MTLHSRPFRQPAMPLKAVRWLQILAGLLCVMLDQLSKITLQNNLCLTGRQTVTRFFNFVCVWNHGISFGLGNMGTATPELQRNLLIGLTGLLTLLVIYWWRRSKNLAEQWGCILIISGAIGNIMDRLHYASVFDFLDFHAFGYHWPAFNLADSLICVGVILLFFMNLFATKKRKYY